MNPIRVPYDPQAARQSLFEALVAARREHGGATPALVDADERVLSYDTLVKGALALGHALKRGTQNGERIRFGPLGSTRMACDAEPTAAAERRFLAVLAAARYAHYDQDTLVLLDGADHQIATFSNAR